MKAIFGIFITVTLFVGALSLKCYRCGGASEACATGGSNTVECKDEGNLIFGCRVYTVNYTTLDQVLDFKSCCFVEECNDNPCEEFGQGTICSKMASCQSDLCNFNYTTTKAGPKPTPKSQAATFSMHSLSMITVMIIIAFAYMK